MAISFVQGPSRRDDIESLAYTVLLLLCGGLPWVVNGIKRVGVLREKLKWSGVALSNGYPAVFGAFLDYARTLAFDEEPDYAGWRWLQTFPSHRCTLTLT